MKLLRSGARAIARRISGWSKGGASRFTIKLVLWFAGSKSQTVFGASLFMFFISGTVIPDGNVRSNLPAMKARIAVERFGIIVHSIPSRYGLPSFQYCAFRSSLMDSFGL